MQQHRNDDAKKRNTLDMHKHNTNNKLHIHRPIQPNTKHERNTKHTKHKRNKRIMERNIRKHTIRKHNMGIQHEHNIRRHKPKSKRHKNRRKIPKPHKQRNISKQQTTTNQKQEKTQQNNIYAEETTTETTLEPTTKPILEPTNEKVTEITKITQTPKYTYENKIITVPCNNENNTCDKETTEITIEEIKTEMINKTEIIGIQTENHQIPYETEQTSCLKTQNIICCWNKQDGGTNLQQRAEEYRTTIRQGESGTCINLNTEEIIQTRKSNAEVKII